MRAIAFLLGLCFCFATQNALCQLKWVAPVTDTPFVQAENMVLNENFDNLPPGKIPARWRMISRSPQRTDSGKLGDLNGRHALIVTKGNATGFEPVMGNRSYLNNSFTIEYDYFQDDSKCTLGCATTIVLRDSLKNHIEIIFSTYGTIDFRCVADNGMFQERKVYSEFQTSIAYYKPELWHHVAISYYNRYIRCYIDGMEIISTNAYIKPTKFAIDGKAVFGISNIKLALNGPARAVKKPEPEKKPAVDTVKKPEPVKIPVAVFDSFETEKKLTTYAIHFESNQSIITPESLPFITQMADWLKEHADIKLEIIGHTDSTGNPDSNKVLSFNRAAAVKTQFEALGVPGERITTKGLGSDKPIRSNSTEEGKAMNRRVEFIKQE